MIAVVVCAWEFVAEMTRSKGGGVHTFMLLFPHIALFLILIAQVFSIVKLSFRTQIIIITTTIVPMTFYAMIHSSFRLGVSLCCCSRSLCPATSLSNSIPDASACGLILNNCYMAFIRKIIHFCGTASLQSPLVTILFETLLRSTRQTVGRRHCQTFLGKTRSA
ncbi:hypothetical protein Plhal703r1_c50g0154541 [Plasmopara halstedii]